MFKKRFGIATSKVHKPHRCSWRFFRFPAATILLTPSCPHAVVFPPSPPFLLRTASLLAAALATLVSSSAIPRDTIAPSIWAPTASIHLIDALCVRRSQAHSATQQSTSSPARAGLHAPTCNERRNGMTKEDGAVGPAGGRRAA